MALASLGLAGPVLATAINNGSNVAAALNGLRPLVRGPGTVTELTHVEPRLSR
jgi:hypothetical protein